MASIACLNSLNRFTGVSEEKQNINLKRFFQHYFATQGAFQRSIEQVIEQQNLVANGAEFLNFVPTTIENLELLKLYGFKETTKEDFIHEDFNDYSDVQVVDNFISKDLKRSFNFYDDLKEKEIFFDFSGNELNFFTFEEEKFLFSLSFEYKISILDAKLIGKNLGLLLRHQEKTFFVLTNLCLEFATKLTSFEDIQCFFKINLNDFYGCLLGFENGVLTLFDYSSNKILQLRLNKKYFFQEGENYWLQSKTTDLPIELSSQFKNPDLQTEFLFLYDLVHLFGLSDFVDGAEQKKINSLLIKEKDQLFKNRFDDTFTGLCNFLNFPKAQTKKNGKYFEILGYLQKNGTYKITIKTTEIKKHHQQPCSYDICIFKKRNDVYYLEDSITLKTEATTFWCFGLMFNLKVLNQQSFVEEFYFVQEIVLPESKIENLEVPVLFEQRDLYQKRLGAETFVKQDLEDDTLIELQEEGLLQQPNNFAFNVNDFGVEIPKGTLTLAKEFKTLVSFKRIRFQLDFSKVW